MSDKKTLDQMYKDSKVPTCERNLQTVATAASMGAYSGFNGPKGMPKSSIPVRVASSVATGAVKGTQAYQKETQRMHECFHNSPQEQVMTYNRAAPITPTNLPPVAPMIYSPMITTRVQAQASRGQGESHQNQALFNMANRW